MAVYRIAEISLPLGGSQSDLRRAAAKRLGVEQNQVKNLRIVKRSVDARKKSDVHFICTVECEAPEGKGEKDPKIGKAVPYRYEIPSCKPAGNRPLVVGFGPAGMFAALVLAIAGLKPIVAERGAPVEERAGNVETFWNTGLLDTESNVQFGEGGAGTFSDGKLNTGTKDSRAGFVLREFVKAGAPEEILWEAKPHIGTDRLPQAVKGIREKILSLGGEILFHTKVTDFKIRDGKIYGVELNGKDILETDTVILAVGHSARDTFQRLYELSIPMEQKPFSLGARIEHAQEKINRSQYGKFAGHPALGAADYRLAVHLPNGRGVYTFCMCPGGEVVAAASEEGRLVTNGMSRHARDGKNANAALLVGILPQDFGSSDVLAGMELQRRIEEKAFLAGGGGYKAPAQKVGDFLREKRSACLGQIQPTYRPGVTPGAMEDFLPSYITESMRMGIRLMDQKLKGFADPEAVLTGPETRSSSPVRILRGENCVSPAVQGLFPCGEGAGYAGGIVSAAVDGMRCAEMAIKKNF